MSGKVVGPSVDRYQRASREVIGNHIDKWASRNSKDWRREVKRKRETPRWGAVPNTRHKIEAEELLDGGEGKLGKESFGEEVFCEGRAGDGLARS